MRTNARFLEAAKDDLAINDGSENFGRKYIFDWNAHDILGQYSEVRTFADFQRTQGILGEGSISRVNSHA